MDSNSSNVHQQIIPQEESGIDIKKYIFLLLNHWWWFAIAIFIALTIVYMINRYSQIVYNVSASIVIGEQGSMTGSAENILNELSNFRSKKRKAVVENEISILSSYKMARLALEELDFNITYTSVGRRGIAESQLYKKSPFIVIPDTAKVNRESYPVNITILSRKKYRLELKENNNFVQVLDFGEKFQSKDFNFTLQLKDPKNYDIENDISKRYYFKFNDVNELAKNYRNKLKIDVNDEKGSILTVNLSDYVPEQVADYLNKLFEVYIRSNLEEKNLASENTIEFIDEQLNSIVDSLENTGLRLQKFRATNKLIDLSKEGSFLFEQMQLLQNEQAIAELSKRYYEYLLKYIQEKDNESTIVAPSVIGIQDQLLNEMVSRLNELNLERKKLKFAIHENTPQISLIIEQIEMTRNTLRENLQNVLEGNEIKLGNINRRIQKIEGEVEKLPSTERQLINIQRKFSINDQIYTFLLEKRAEAGITRASNTSDHRILDIARSENAVVIKPNTTLNYLFGLLAGAGIPLISLLLFEFFNTKIIDRKYLETSLKAPIIGNIGHNDGSTDLPIAEKPGSSLAESFRALRTNLQYILKDKQKGIIALTSAVSGEGKTFCSVNLAGILALSGKKTLLVSLDLRRPKIHKIFNLTNEEGISTYLINKSEFNDLLYQTNINNLFVATSGPIPPNPAELIGSEKMRDFFTEAEKHFDYIIVDTPPIAIVTDTLALQDILDSLIFVVRHNYSNRQVVELANSIYEKTLIKNLGVVVNDIALKGYYGYSYRYGYGYGYGYSYNYREAYYKDEIEKDSIFSKFLKRFKLK